MACGGINMSTVFSITCTKGNGLRYSIELGRNILEGKTDEAIRAMAEDAAIVALQNRKGSLLRVCNGPEDVVDVLKGFGYPNATVELYVEKPRATKPVTQEDVKAYLKKMTPAELAEYIATFQG